MGYGVDLCHFLGKEALGDMPSEGGLSIKLMSWVEIHSYHYALQI